MNNSNPRYNNKIFAYQYEYSEGTKSNNCDIEHYVDCLRDVDVKVLEIGCGTGRIWKCYLNTKNVPYLYRFRPSS